MTIYATTAAAPFQRTEEERRLDAAIKAIGDQHALVLVNLQTWRLHRDQSPRTAQQALDRLADARQRENALFREVLGINPERPVLPKG